MKRLLHCVVVLFAVVSALSLACPAAFTRAAAGAEPALAGVVVCLDPGHGGDADQGAVFDDGFLYLEERDINLDISFALKAMLEAEGAGVLMTRTTDSFYDNRDRYTFCNQVGATILISIHTNSVVDQSYDGTYTLYFQDDDRVLAGVMHSVILKALGSTVPDGVEVFRDFGLGKFASGVLMKSDMPAAMMEPLFMSHPSEAYALAQPIGQPVDPGCAGLSCRRGQIASAVFAGILDYFRQYPVEPPSDPTPTPAPGNTVHVGDLDGASTSVGNTWSAVIAVRVDDAWEGPVAGATVMGDWSGGSVGFGSCTTDESGWCRFEIGGVPKRAGSISFSVSDVVPPDGIITYDPDLNHDPDGDSDGTHISVLKP